MGSIITGLLIVTICVLPFVLMNRRHRKKEKEFLTALYSMAGNRQVKISKYDSWSNAAIGIDANKSVIFFTKRTDEGNINLQVELQDIRQCRIERTNSPDYKSIDRLELFLIPKAKEKAVTALAFYNAAPGSPTLAGELQLAEKWCSTINSRLAILKNQS